MDYVWFWTFWHWSREGHRDGALLRGPLHGIGGHWDEWFRHEASADDRRAIEAAGRFPDAQRRFVAWLARRWAGDASWAGARPPVRFVLGQLAQVPPFDGWSAFARYRTGYGVQGVSAVVLAEGSAGEAADVRAVEALLLPCNPDAAAPHVVAEGFEADPVELHAAWRAATGLLGGRGLWRLLAVWLVRGRRPYPAWLRAALAAGWAAVAGGMLFLLAGPEPGDALLPIAGGLLLLWASLVFVAGVVAVHAGVQAWRHGVRARDALARGEVRLRMHDGLILKGGSAGLAFCLNMLLAGARARPREAPLPWLWRGFHATLRAGAGRWAATGVVAADGRVEAVVLAPKLRASLLHRHVLHLLAPRQGGAAPRQVVALGAALTDARPADAERVSAGYVPTGGVFGGVSGPRLGFASAPPRLRVHRCRHAALAVVAVGGLHSGPQLATNALAVAVSGVVAAALPDLARIVRPPPAPPVVGPASPSPYYLWVSLDTKYPDAFAVELESEYWTNRRAPVVDRAEAGAPPRAELRLVRSVRPASPDPGSGTVWVERRRRFLTREFLPGARVGRYTFAYVARAGRG